MTITELKKELYKYADKERASFAPVFYKMWKGGYGEGDKFIGVSVPNGRKVAKQFVDSSFNVVAELLKDEIHEVRLTWLEILVHKYEKASKQSDLALQKKIVDFYLANLDGVNNRDLVDASAYKILWKYLLDKQRIILYKYAESHNLWKRRIAIVTTYAFIKNDEVKDTFAIAALLVSDEHDLIHKAVGWMMREAGKRDEKSLIKFLDKYADTMPRTMLRYSLERVDKKLKSYYMNMKKNNES